MRKLAVLAGVAALGLASQANAAIYTGSLTLTIGDSGDGLPVGTGPQIPAGPFFTADGTWALGNIDSLGDRTWSSSSPNTLASITPVDNRFYALAGSNGTSYYNPYDQLVDGAKNYVDGEAVPLTCIGEAILTPYSCGNLEGKALKVRPTPIEGTGPLPTATGLVTIDTVAGTMTGVLNYNDRGDGYAYDYRSADGSPFNASQNSVSALATLAINFTGTFTATSWNVTGGTAAVNDSGFLCTPGDLSGTLCNPSAVLGGLQLNGSALSWINVPVYDKIDTDITRVLLTTIPGAVLTASLDGSGNVTTSSGEFHRALGSAGSNCSQDTVYSGGKMSCGNLIAGKFLAAGTFTETVVPAPAGVWLLGTALGAIGLRRKLKKA
jgi:hypothetical protein